MRNQWQASAKYPGKSTNCSLYRENNHKIVYSISVGKFVNFSEKEVGGGVRNLNSKCGVRTIQEIEKK